MDPSEVHPDLLGEALSHSGQRLAQLGSLLTSWAVVQARRTERRAAARAARSEQQLRELREQESAAWRLARAGWAPSQDRRWLASAGLLDAARAWSAAAAWADADPDAASAQTRCEERLRSLNPYAMARYDRLRAEGAAPFDAMRDVLPLFARAPHARPGHPSPQRRALAAEDQAPGDSPWQQDGHQQPRAASGTPWPDASPDTAAGDAARLAAESFPWTVSDAVRASTASPPRDPARPRGAVPEQATQRSLSL